MKLIKQTVLHLKEGSADKVYEVDLCEVGPDSFVVNFRYGRRGANLKEGAKTAKAVPRRAAEKVFDELVTSKTKKGYRDVTGQAADLSKPAARSVTRSVTVNVEARRQAVLARLGEAARRGGRKPAGRAWPLERVIWRAGELELAEAAPILTGLIGSGEALRDYCIAWALGWCGDGSAVTALRRLYEGKATPDAVRRIAGEALLKLWDEAARAAFRADLIERLPQELRGPARGGPPDAFAAAFNDYLAGGDFRRFEALDTIYLIDNENVRPALLATLRAAPLRPNYFQRLRHIFKAAEYRRDAEVFGLLAYRFEKARAMFRNEYHGLDENRKGTYASLEGSRYLQNAEKEIRSAASTIAYGSRTRLYLRKRVWRALRRLGQAGNPDYVKMAVGVLLPYTDADARPVKVSSFYNYETGRTRRIHWDAYASYWAFNHILYGNSPRYVLKPNSIAWRCRSSYKPGAPAPPVREESFPGLWEQVPVGLLHLIADSNCRSVLEFAVTALGACRPFLAELEAEAVAMILSRPYEVTARFGFELARERYRPEAPDPVLVLAVADCVLAEARAEAHRWVGEGREHFLNDSAFLAGLAASPQADTRAFARNLLRSAALPGPTARAVVGRLIARLLRLGAADAGYARDVVETLLGSFGPQLRTIGVGVVLDLLAHPSVEVQELGGSILLNHESQANDLPAGVIDSLIKSPHQSIRGIGLRLFGQLSDETLLGNEGLLASLAMHELADVRQAIRPVIRRLVAVDTGFAARLVDLFIRSLLAPESQEGVHRSLAQLLREDLGGGWMADATRETAWDLVRAKSPAAQELGGVLIDSKVNADPDWADGFATAEIAELSDHEALAVRQAARAIFARVSDRFRRATNPDHLAEMAQAVRLFDSPWEDSRNYWFEAFRRFTAEDFTPGILVSICDSVREDVQRFGRELITRHFAAADGQEYLLKLSEHPSANLQLFATNYLERYAAGDPARLKELSYYFTSVLARVNKARVAKGRVLAFLATEARKSEEAARVVAEILARQSATIAVGDKAAAIEAMVQIGRAYPQVPLPIQVKEPEVRHAV